MSVIFCKTCDTNRDTDFVGGAYGPISNEFMCEFCLTNLFDECMECRHLFRGENSTDENCRCPKCAEKALGAGEFGLEHPTGYETPEAAVDGYYLAIAEATLDKNMAENVCPETPLPWPSRISPLGTL